MHSGSLVVQLGASDCHPVGIKDAASRGEMAGSYQLFMQQISAALHSVPEPQIVVGKLSAFR
jgi:hypothetical protein